jgi:hypothetical protein
MFILSLIFDLTAAQRQLNKKLQLEKKEKNLEIKDKNNINFYFAIRDNKIIKKTKSM